MDILAVIERETLPMGKEAEHVQAQALAAALPVCINIVDVAGQAVHNAFCQQPRPRLAHATTAAARMATDSDAEQCHAPTVHLLHSPGHYEVLCPAEEARNVKEVLSHASTAVY